MIEHEQVDQTTLNILEVYRRQVTDLETKLHNAEERRMFEEGEHESEEQKRKQTDEQLDFERERHREERDAAEKKITKLEGIIESLKIELQDERAAHTKTKEGSE
ncbi:hypothetical protein [Corynebacterium kalidii]